MAAVSTGLAPPNIDCAATLFGASVCTALELTVFGLRMSFGRSCGTEIFSPPVEVCKMYISHWFLLFIKLFKYPLFTAKY